MSIPGRLRRAPPVQRPGRLVALVRGRHRVVGHQVRAPAAARRLRLRAQVHPLDPQADPGVQRRRRALRRHLRAAPARRRRRAAPRPRQRHLAPTQTIIYDYDNKWLNVFTYHSSIV